MMELPEGGASVAVPSSASGVDPGTSAGCEEAVAPGSLSQAVVAGVGAEAGVDDGDAGCAVTGRVGAADVDTGSEAVWVAARRLMHARRRCRSTC